MQPQPNLRTSHNLARSVSPCCLRSAPGVDGVDRAERKVSALLPRRVMMESSQSGSTVVVRDTDILVTQPLQRTSVGKRGGRWWMI